MSYMAPNIKYIRPKRNVALLTLITGCLGLILPENIFQPSLFEDLNKRLHCTIVGQVLVYPTSQILSQIAKSIGANTGPTLVLSAPDGPHVGPMNLATCVSGMFRNKCEYILVFAHFSYHNSIKGYLRPITRHIWVILVHLLDRRTAYNLKPNSCWTRAFIFPRTLNCQEQNKHRPATKHVEVPVFRVNVEAQLLCTP